jgi:hypothetical protein
MAEHSTVATSAVRPNKPARQVIATFENYADAERAVDYLSDQRFEVNRVAIVGRDLEYVEQVLGRLTYGAAGRRCAVPARAPWSARCRAVAAISTPSADCGPRTTTSSPTLRWPTVRCTSSLVATEGNRRWQQR